jgi:hypothetical protein
MQLKHRMVGTFMSACVFAFATAASASTVLTDSAFSSVVATSHSGDPLGTAAGSVCASCGNPGAALFATVTSSAGGASSISSVGFVDFALSYDPGTQGAIGSINASYDRLLRATFPFSLAFNFRLVIEQGGVDYVTAINLGGPDTGGVFHTLSTSNLVASSFSSFNFTTGIAGSAHPDFTTGAMLFGVMALTQTQDGQTFDAIFDNITVTVNQSPLPAALPLFAGGLGVIGLLARRKKRNAQAA